MEVRLGQEKEFIIFRRWYYGSETLSIV